MTVFVIAGLCSLGLPGLSGFVAEMSVFMGAWQNPETYNRTATVLACASIVVTAVYILRAVGSTGMGPIKNADYLNFRDAAWNEKLASATLIICILAIGIAPFWLNNLVSPDTQLIMTNVTRTVILK